MNSGSFDKFLSPESMLTPGLAGGMTMGITNALAFQFNLIAPQPALIALILSFLFGLCVFLSAKKRHRARRESAVLGDQLASHLHRGRRLQLDRLVGIAGADIRHAARRSGCDRASGAERACADGCRLVLRRWQRQAAVSRAMQRTKGQGGREQRQGATGVRGRSQRGKATRARILWAVAAADDEQVAPRSRSR
jgi:hypothetical protein